MCSFCALKIDAIEGLSVQSCMCVNNAHFSWQQTEFQFAPVSCLKIWLLM